MKILNFGSLNIDYTYDVDHFVRSGETLSSLALHSYAGGKGLNQSVAAGRSGAEIWHAGAVGSGDGDFLLELLDGARVHTDFVAHVPGKTGHAIIQRDKAGQNCILLYGGANRTITAEQAEKVLELFHVGDWLMLQNEISSVGEIMRLAHQRGMRIALNPSPMSETVLTYPLKYVDLLILNEVEAGALCPNAGTDGKSLLHALSNRFSGSTLVLTLGKAGAWYHDGEQDLFQPSFSVPVADTTGAGDTFTGFLLGALARGETLAQAIREATAAAAVAVSRPGAAPSIPTYAEMSEFLGIHGSEA
ncbi:ribokinase [Oscillibacter valericigenes Sjm18-20]|nr:ribokinase [Oscillibacter valericigenes Sjm18-20]